MNKEVKKGFSYDYGQGVEALGDVSIVHMGGAKDRHLINPMPLASYLGLGVRKADSEKFASIVDALVDLKNRGSINLRKLFEASRLEMAYDVDKESYLRKLEQQRVRYNDEGIAKSLLYMAVVFAPTLKSGADLLVPIHQPSKEVVELTKSIVRRVTVFYDMVHSYAFGVRMVGYTVRYNFNALTYMLNALEVDNVEPISVFIASNRQVDIRYSYSFYDSSFSREKSKHIDISNYVVFNPYINKVFIWTVDTENHLLTEDGQEEWLIR